MSNRLPPTLKITKFGPFFVNVKGAIHNCVVCKDPTAFRVPFNQKVAKKLFQTNSGSLYMPQTKSYICSISCLKALISEKLFSLSIKATPEVEDFILNAVDAGVKFRYSITSLKTNTSKRYVTTVYRLDGTNFLFIKAYRYSNPGYNWKGDVEVMTEKDLRSYVAGLTSLHLE